MAKRGRGEASVDSRVAAIDHDALRWSGTADCASRERDEEAETPRDEGWKEGRGRQTRRPCPQLRTGYVKQAAGVGLTCLHLSTSSCCIQGCPLPPLPSPLSKCQFFRPCHFRLPDRVVHQGVALRLPWASVPHFFFLPTSLHPFRGASPSFRSFA